MHMAKLLEPSNAPIRTVRLLPLVVILAASISFAQERCAVELAKAEEKYQQGRLDEAIDLLHQCLRKGDLPATENKQMYRLLAKAYLSKGQLNRAKDNLRTLLRAMPDWGPDSEIEAPSFVTLAEEVIAEVELERAREARKEALSPSTSEKIEIGIGGGFALPKGPVPSFSDSAKIGFVANVAVDFYLSQQLTIGGSLSFLTFDKKFPTPNAQGGHLNILPFLCQLKYYLQPLQSRRRVYFAAGLGMAISRRVDTTIGATKIEGERGNDVVFTFGVGVKLKLGANTKIVIEGLVSQVAIDKPQISDGVITYIPLQAAIVF
jgi:tetratricopeptide (TPR) repeat protein